MLAVIAKTLVKSAPDLVAGNFCRSPLAEGVFKDMVAKRADKDEWKIDSAGTSDWHDGEHPDERTNATLQEKIGHRSDHLGRKVSRCNLTHLLSIPILCGLFLL